MECHEIFTDCEESDVCLLDVMGDAQMEEARKRSAAEMSNGGGGGANLSFMEEMRAMIRLEFAENRKEQAALVELVKKQTRRSTRTPPC